LPPDKGGEEQVGERREGTEIKGKGGEEDF